MADFLMLTTLSDLNALVSDGGAESLYLEFKASDALSPEKIDEICNDVTAFANAAGGQIIYGIAEDKKAKLFRIDSGIANPKSTVNGLTIL